ncbi:hypothetical protein [Deinococcus pimensis]|uniref:hypothetical protein n=1 Tax=Deinococcus pimensis TaxID=309888 RepID=UPI0004840FF6|nr:hypothetical protein [Deinococcus pimensis]
MTDSTYKLGVLDAEHNESPYTPPHVWQQQATSGPKRLVLAPRGGQVALLKALAAVIPEPFGLLYVLVASRGEHEVGRYQSGPLSRLQVEAFLEEFETFLELDGRHHVWISSLESDALLVYDAHNIIYAYGPLRKFVEVAHDLGMQEGLPNVPYPHSHHYHSTFDATADRLMRTWPWRRFPLEETDDD